MACLNTDILLQLPLTLPPLALQFRIAAVLDTVDEAIAKTEAVIAKLKQVRAGQLHDLLARGIDEHGQLRDPIAHPEQFQDSPLGCIPRTWRCKTLEEAAEWFSGGTPSRSQVAWWQGDVPILTPKDMKVFKLSDTLEHVTEEAAQTGSRVMPASTAFIVVRGMILAHTFPVCLSTRLFAFNQDIKAVCGRDGLNTRFLAYWFAANSALFLRKATEATHGTKKLDLDELHRIRIAIPSPEEQQNVVKRIEAIDANIAIELDKHAKLDLVKSGLMANLLTGRVCVPEEFAVSS
jgi:type I restriction enzyme S subunit